jgi:hypothetical protein
MAIMNRVYATLLVVLVVLCQIITAQSEKTHIGDLSSAQIEEQIQVGFLSSNNRHPMLENHTHSIRIVLSSSLSMLTRLQQHTRLLQASQLEHLPYCSLDHLPSTHFCSLLHFLSTLIHTNDKTGASSTSLVLPISCWLYAPQTSTRHP